MEKSTLDILLNGMSLSSFGAYFILGMIGVIVSMLAEILRTNNKCKAKGETFTFSLGYWIKDNFIRLVLSMIIVILGVLYTKDLLGIEINSMLALSAGFNSDKLVEIFKTKINLNQ